MKKLIAIASLLLITTTTFSAELNCSVEVDKARSMVSADGSVENEVEFVKAADLATLACTQLAETKKNIKLQRTLLSAKVQCVSAARQQSDLFLGTCYFKVADLARTILGE